MSTASTATKRYLPASDRNPWITALPVSEPELERHLWRISTALFKKSDGDWLFYLFFGVLALLIMGQAFFTLFHLLDTDALTHFVENVIRSTDGT